MAATIALTLNGHVTEVSVDPDTPLLYVLMNELALKGPKFGCGLGQCGTCSVLADGVEVRSCQMSVSAAARKKITTSEGLPALYAEQRKLSAVPDLHPLQQAFIAEEVPQCGYCISGVLIKASELLAKNPKPSDAEIRAHMNGHLCRCATYPRMMAAIQRAARQIAGGVA